MSLPFSREAFFAIFAAYNEKLWPFALLLWFLTGAAFLQLVRGRIRSDVIAGLLAIHWAWAGLAYHAVFFSRINPAAWGFSLLFLLEAGLLAWHGVIRGDLRFSRTRSFRHVLSSFLVIYALLYPAIARAEGHFYPETPTFGVPCPTAILTVGLLLAAQENLPRRLIVVPIAWAFIGGSAAFLLAVRADWMLPVAGILLWIDELGFRGQPVAAEQKSNHRSDSIDSRL
jgi:hypothetical protein